MTVLSQMQAGLRTSLDPEMPQGSPSGARTQPRGGGGRRPWLLPAALTIDPPAPRPGPCLSLSAPGNLTGLGSEGLRRWQQLEA